MYALLQGYLTGDGCGIRASGRIRWATISPHLAVKSPPSQRHVVSSRRCSYSNKGRPTWEGHFTPDYKVRQADLRMSDDRYVWHPVRRIVTNRDPVAVHDLTVDVDHSFVVRSAAVHNCYGRLSDLHGATCHYLLGVGPEEWGDEFRTIAEVMAARIDAKRRSNAAATDGEDYVRVMGESILGEVLAELAGVPATRAGVR
jgi:hypothetical protein